MEGPEAWYASDYKNDDSYIITLTEADVSELDAAVQSVVQSRQDLKVGSGTHQMHASWYKLRGDKLISCCLISAVLPMPMHTRDFIFGMHMQQNRESSCRHRHACLPS